MVCSGIFTTKLEIEKRITMALFESNKYVLRLYFFLHLLFRCIIFYQISGTLIEIFKKLSTVLILTQLRMFITKEYPSNTNLWKFQTVPKYSFALSKYNAKFYINYNSKTYSYGTYMFIYTCIVTHIFIVLTTCMNHFTYIYSWQN